MTVIVTIKLLSSVHTRINHVTAIKLDVIMCVLSLPDSVLDEVDAAVSDLEAAAELLAAQADDGNFTVFVDGVEYIIERQNISGVVDCGPGMTRVSTLCG